jgi:hypothetical protein
MSVSTALWLLACTVDDSPGLSGGEPQAADGGSGDDGLSEGDDGGGGEALWSDVVAVTATGDAGAYTFAATISSPDVDCDRYSDWWEVLTPEGALVFRRILDHSHAHEQPFTRDGGPVEVAATDPLVVRGHFHPTGYGGAAMEGSVAEGFAPAPAIERSFAAAVESQAPQPDKCLF